jgi:HemY protein
MNKLPRPLFYLMWLMVAIVLAAIINAAFGEDAGYVKMQWNGRVVQTSFIGLLMMLAVLYFTIRGIVHIFRMPRKLGEAVKTVNQNRARQRLTQGMIDVSEGNFSQAEKRLTKAATKSETPLLNYLNAARAAQAQGKSDRRDKWLKQAYENTPEAAKAILLTQAELQLEADEFELSLATLQKLEEISPGHKQSLRLQAKLFERLEDWPQLRNLIPRLRQYKAFDKYEIDQLSLLANKEILIDAGEVGQLQDAWDALDKVTRSQPKLIAIYAQGLLALGQDKLAETAVTKALKKHWDECLLETYANLTTLDAAKQLAQIETWLKKRGESATLLHVAAKLCMRNQLWGKARSYIESSLALEATPASHQLHGELLQHLGEANEASEAFKKGLMLYGGEIPKPALPKIAQID